MKTQGAVAGSSSGAHTEAEQDFATHTEQSEAAGAEAGAEAVGSKNMHV